MHARTGARSTHPPGSGPCVYTSVRGDCRSPNVGGSVYVNLEKGAVIMFRMGILLAFVWLVACAEGPHGGVSHCTCGEPNEIELTAAHGLSYRRAWFILPPRVVYPTAPLPPGTAGTTRARAKGVTHVRDTRRSI